ncbi:MAG: porin [Verrucomicrobia bacterium]|nr:porin [Verrucomicrobiota bacterium]
MSSWKSTRRALLGALLLTGPLLAQESGALIDALIRKGILTVQEAEDIRADLVRESNTIPAHAFGGGKATDRLSVGMRVQAQYANIGTEIKGNPVRPVYTDQPFLRRMYLTLKAGVGGNWGATFTYDFASGYYDDAIVEWKPTPDLSFNFGLRKVAVGYEERASSGNLKSIERSGVTRYFVEGNNGRRLGAASYRIGAFLDGKKAINRNLNFVYTAAITDPERSDAFADASAAGDAATNHVAFWGTAGLAGKLASNGTWVAGFGAGHMPDRGGPGNTNFGRGYDLSLYSTYFDIQAGRFGLMAEYLTANVERGVSLTRDAKPAGWFIQPSLLLSESLEAVVRYQQLDTDGRGLNLGDVTRSAPSGGTMNKFDEWYAGLNLYLRGNDLKFQLGAFTAKSKETVTGAHAEATATGVRSQVQLQF